MNEGTRQTFEDCWTTREQLIPLRRAAQPAEQAATALFFSSGEASYISGLVALADGGTHALYASATVRRPEFTQGPGEAWTQPQDEPRRGMDDLNRMLIEHECRKLMILYCNHLDHSDPESFAGIYAEDAMYKPAALPDPIHGRPAILEWAKAYPKHRLGRHFSTNQLVEVVDEDRATGRSYAVVFREPDPREGTVSTRVTPRSVVEYFDEFRRTAEGWRIASRYYQVQFMEEGEAVRPLPWTP